ncbi:MAG: putative metal-binding motif-containing protein [Alphaproteobacteria bacterium]|nr:putative metal-binding motif-containing protein [Alphaproteobacteria bacterium]
MTLALLSLMSLGCWKTTDELSNCTGLVDGDGDGYSVLEDCDDADPATYPGAPEGCEDFVDRDCDGRPGCADCEWDPYWGAPDLSLVRDEAPQYDRILRTHTTLSGHFDSEDGVGGFVYITEETNVLTGDSSVVCDNEYSLSGTAYAGDCEGCDFAFSVESTLDRENGVADCGASVVRTFTENSVILNPTLAFWSEYAAAGYYGTYYYEDVLANGVSVDYGAYGGGYYAGPYWQLLASTYEGDDGGDYVNLDGSLLEFAVYWDATSADGDNLYYNYCDYVYSSYAYAAYDAPSGNTSTIACNDYYVDAWEVDLSDASAFRVTVDTIAADTAADLAFWVNDPSGCSVVWADDSFDCTYEPTDWQCPSVEYDVDTPGTYTVYVKAWGSCTGDEGAYDISVSRKVSGG